MTEWQQRYSDANRSGFTLTTTKPLSGENRVYRRYSVAQGSPLRGSERFLNLGLQDNDIACVCKLLEVLAANADAELLALQFRNVLISLGRRYFFHIAALQR